MAIYGYENYSEVQQHFTEIHLEMVKELGAKRIVWQDPLDFGVEVRLDYYYFPMNFCLSSTF